MRFVHKALLSAINNSKRRKLLDDLGFVWSPPKERRRGRNDDFGDYFVFEDVVESLSIYKSMYRDFSNLTNSDFVMPAPKEVTGFLDDDSVEIFDVDASARAAAAIASFEEQGQIDRSEDFIAAEIKRLQREVDQPFEKESRTAVLEAEKFAGKWPEHLAGMALGSLGTRMCEGSLEVKHLPAILFRWPKVIVSSSSCRYTRVAWPGTSLAKGRIRSNALTMPLLLSSSSSSLSSSSS